MLNSYLRSRDRWIAMGFLLILTCAAAGRSAQDREAPAPQAWPKEVERPGARITIYEPLLESLRGNRLTARAAVSVLPRGASEPRFGALWLEADLAVDPERRTARPERLRVTEVRLRNADSVTLAELREAAAAEIARWNLAYSMDALLAELRQIEERKAAAQALKAEVPDIVFRTHPAVLLSIDGEPEWRPVTDHRYRRLANSAFFVVEDPEAGSVYLHIAPFWWSATTVLGPWRSIEEAPGSAAELWRTEPKPRLPDGDPAADEARRPEVVVATRPTELIWTDGPPQFAPIDGTDLLYVRNTASDVFLEIQTQMSYVLLSGRWFRTPYGKVAWEFVPSDRLPIDFSLIPLSSEKQHVLACVAGTSQAREAVRDAEIPRTRAVAAGPAPELEATYDGEPRFTEIEDGSVRYAVNSPYAIFSVDRRYYWCYDGAWYDSDWAAGPWSVCTWVPRPIYLIPPSCPYYYVTYCRLFSVSPQLVYYGFYPGYRGCYVWGRTIVYGTGWTYRGWTGDSCYPRPVTWGVCVRYDPYVCSWTYRAGWGTSYSWTGAACTTSWSGSTWTVGAGGGYATLRYGYGYRSSTGADVPVRVLSAPSSAPQRRAPSAPEPSRPRPSDSERGPSLGRRNDGEAPPPRPSMPLDDDESFRTPPRRREDGPRSEIPRTPPGRPEREAPDPSPPRIDRREPPRAPAAERRELPPPPPSADRREPHRNPPPPPPVERRDPPRNPPPQHERRDPPRSPPPQQERRDPPRNPPPQQERRDPPRSPPPPPPQQERRSPPPPPPQERREGPKEPPRGPDRRR